MSRFYASIKGNRGQATRQGTKNSGIEGHVRGWEVGGEVNCYVNENGEDEVALFLTSGSNHRRTTICVGRYTEKDLYVEIK